MTIILIIVLSIILIITIIIMIMIVVTGVLNLGGFQMGFFQMFVLQSVAIYHKLHSGICYTKLTHGQTGRSKASQQMHSAILTRCNPTSVQTNHGQLDRCKHHARNPGMRPRLA